MAVPSPPLARSSNAFFPYSPSIGLASSRIAPRHKAAVPCMWAVKEQQKFFHSPLFLVAWLSVFLLALYHLPGMNRCPQFDTARNRFFFSSHENFFILLAECESI